MIPLDPAFKEGAVVFAAGNTLFAAPAAKLFAPVSVGPLAASATWTSPTLDMGEPVDGYLCPGSAYFFFLSPTAGTYYLECSDDGVTWIKSNAGGAVTAGSPVNTSRSVLERYQRFVFVNGTTAQSTASTFKMRR